MANAVPTRAQVPRVLVRRTGALGCGILGGALAAITAGVYMTGSGRSLDYDSSVTVGAFIKTDSVVDPFRRQIALNNHPLFSVLEHVVWSAGFHSETALRVLPVLCGAATVACVAAWCASRWGLLAGFAAGTVVAANPMFAELSRELRGYSLLSLCATLSTIFLWRLRESEPNVDLRRVELAYVVLVAAGISTHLYGCAVLLVHAGIVIARRELNAVWVFRWVAAVFLGCLIYLATIHSVLNTSNARTFYADFPWRAAVPLFGQARVAVVALGIVVVCALWLIRSHTAMLGGVAAALTFLAFVWLVVQPQFLVVRYLTWLVPGVALAAAFLVARWKPAILLVAVAVTAMVAHQWSDWTTTQMPTAQTAAVIDIARANGFQVCGIAHSAIAVLAYTRQPTRPTTVAELARCSVLVGFYVTPRIDRFEKRVYRYSWRVPGELPGFVYSSQPKAVVEAGMTRTRDTLDTHPRTWPS